MQTDTRRLCQHCIGCEGSAWQAISYTDPLPAFCANCITAYVVVGACNYCLQRTHGLAGPMVADLPCMLSYFSRTCSPVRCGQQGEMQCAASCTHQQPNVATVHGTADDMLHCIGTKELHLITLGDAQHLERFHCACCCPSIRRHSHGCRCRARRICCLRGHPSRMAVAWES